MFGGDVDHAQPNAASESHRVDFSQDAIQRSRPRPAFGKSANNHFRVDQDNHTVTVTIATPEKPAQIMQDCACLPEIDVLVIAARDAEDRSEIAHAETQRHRHTERALPKLVSHAREGHILTVPFGRLGNP